MTRKEAVADLIDRYVFAVGQELPRDLRSDVVTELRTLIEDAIDDRGRAAQRDTDLTLAADVLTEMGRPADVARRYHPSARYLIGPALYSDFVKVLRIVFAGLVGLVLISVGVGEFLESGSRAFSTPNTWIRLLTTYLQMAIVFFGVTVVIFALIERGIVRLPKPDRKWDPRELPPIPIDDDRASPTGATVRIALVTLLAVVMLFFPRWIGFTVIGGAEKGGISFVALADMGLHIPVGAVVAWCAAVVALNLVVLRQRRWTTVTRWSDVGLDLIAALLLFDVAGRSLLHAPASLSHIEPLVRPLGIVLTVLPFALLLAALVETIELAVRGWRRFKPSADPIGSDGAQR